MKVTNTIYAFVSATNCFCWLEDICSGHWVSFTQYETLAEREGQRCSLEVDRALDSVDAVSKNFFAYTTTQTQELLDHLERAMSQTDRVISLIQTTLEPGQTKDEIAELVENNIAFNPDDFLTANAVSLEELKHGLYRAVNEEGRKISEQPSQVWDNAMGALKDPAAMTTSRRFARKDKSPPPYIRSRPVRSADINPEHIEMGDENADRTEIDTDIFEPELATVNVFEPNLAAVNFPDVTDYLYCNPIVGELQAELTQTRIRAGDSPMDTFIQWYDWASTERESLNAQAAALAEKQLVTMTNLPAFVDSCIGAFPELDAESNAKLAELGLILFLPLFVLM